MMTTIWGMPEEAMSADKARRAILLQHERIRGLLARGLQIAESSLDGQPPSSDAVASAIGDIRSVMEVHLAFEEHALAPVLTVDPRFGVIRLRALEQEHRAQRRLLANIHGEAMSAPELPTLAAKLAFLTTMLTRDMDEEEGDLLRALAR